MADIWDSLEADYGSGAAAVAPTPTVPLQASPGADIWDSLEADYGEPEPTFLQNIWSDIKGTPGAALEMVKSIPTGVSNLAHLPGDALYFGNEGVKQAWSAISGDPYTPSGTFEELQERQGRAEDTLSGTGLLASGVAGGVATKALAPLGISSSSLGFDKLLQLVGIEPETTAEEDAAALRTGTVQNTLLLGAGKAAAKGTSKLISSVDDLANRLDRKSIGTRASDYGSASETGTIVSPEGVASTFKKQVLNDLLEEGKLGKSRDPSVMMGVVDKATRKLNKGIDEVIASFDETGAKAPHPDFSNALEYVYKGKVPGNEIPNYIRRLDELDQGILKNGEGRLSFLQEQKKSIGKNYSTVDAVKAGFEREMYKDLQLAIEKATPEVKPLNAELGKFIEVEPIIKRGLKASENRSPLNAIADVAWTTGGIGAPTIAGSVMGGPIGALLGATVGVGGKVLKSPGAQAAIARGIRKVGGVKDAFTRVFGDQGPTSEGSSLRPSQSTLAEGTSRPSSVLATKNPSSTETSTTLPSYKYGPDTSASKVLSDDGFTIHYNNTIKELPALENLLKGVAGKNPIKTDIKTKKRAAEKVAQKIGEGSLEYSEKSLGDLIRGRIETKTTKAAYKALEQLKSKGEVTSVTDYLTKPNQWGYKGINANVKLGEAIGEVQFHTPESLAIQKALHPLFEKWRDKRAPVSVLKESNRLAKKVSKEYGPPGPGTSLSAALAATGVGEESEDTPLRQSIKNVLGGDAMKKIDLEATQLSKLDKAQIMAESSGDADAVGPKTKYGTAKGAMQLLDSTGKEWHDKLVASGDLPENSKYDPFNETQNIKIGVAYRDWLMDKFGDVKLALAAYNWGPGNLQKLINRLDSKSFEDLEGHMPLETRNYVKRITNSILA